MASVPPPVQPGQTLAAAWLNQLRDAVDLRSQIRAGAGIDLSVSERALVISLSRAFREYMVWGVITQRYGADPDERANVKYDAQGIGRPEAKVIARVPDLGIGEAVKIHPAPLNAPCVIVRLPKDDGTTNDLLWVFEGAMGERRAVAVCEPPPEPGAGTLAAPAVRDQEQRDAVRTLARLVAQELVETGLIGARGTIG